MTIRKKIHEIIEISHDNNILSRCYDILMTCAILTSIIPLAFKEQYLWIDIVEMATVTLFVIDYLLRWLTADLKKGTSRAYVIYPFTPMAIIDLLSILPSLTVLNKSFKFLKIF